MVGEPTSTSVQCTVPSGLCEDTDAVPGAVVVMVLLSALVLLAAISYVCAGLGLVVRNRLRRAAPRHARPASIGIARPA